MMMTYGRMNNHTAKLIRRLNRGLITKYEFDMEMSLILKQHRAYLRHLNGVRLDLCVARFQDGKRTMDEMIGEMYEQQLSYESAWH